MSEADEEFDTEWDEKQRVVIEYDEDEFGLVEAGPGTGKTAVACRRIGYLIEDRQLEASKIMLVSFTRVAVKELRDRIESFVTDPALLAGLKICTLDSFTWGVLRGMSEADPAELLRGYQENIQAFSDRLLAEDRDILEFLEELEHVIIDEAQDLVGVRAELVINLLYALPVHCGATVFADSAQAIYGWTTEYGDEDHGESTVVERIRESFSDDFTSSTLEVIHRTKDAKLVDLYSRGRSLALEKVEASGEDWSEMANLVRENAHDCIDTKIYEESLDDREDVLVLYRSRLEALYDSSHLWNGEEVVQHKIRMGGMPASIHPWIARVLGAHRDTYISKDEFCRNWDERIGESICDVEKEQGWDLLSDHAADGGGRVDLRRLRALLSRSRPLIDFIVDEKNLPGPTLGTIHASKGREADCVYLAIPDKVARFALTPAAIAEEMRVLFVGASRARERLVIAKQANISGKQKPIPGKRVFRHVGRADKVQAEIGLRDDIDVTAAVSMARFDRAADVEKHQNYLWRQDQQIRDGKPSRPLAAIYDSEKRRNILYEDLGLGQYYRVARGKEIAWMSARFGQDLFVLGRSLNRDNFRPSGQIRHIRMTGVRTAVIPEEHRGRQFSPFRESGLVLVPVIFAFTTISFRNT